MAENPNPGMLLYPRIRKSPFFYASRRHGVALYGVYNRTYHPRHYGDPVAEYWALLNGVTLWDVGVERQIEITGPDAFEFTNMLVSRNLHKCDVGQCKYVFVTGEDGGILNDPVLLRLGENHFWLSLADSDILLWARGVAYRSGYDVHIAEADVGPLQVQGPQSEAVMRDLFGDAVDHIQNYRLRDFDLDGIKVVVSRTGYSGEVGFEIYVTNASRDGVRAWDLIWEAGKPHGMRVIGPCHIRRIEGGLLAHGADMDFDTNPYEVGMGQNWMVNLKHEDFIGMDALRRIKEEGPSRKLVGVQIGGERLGSFNDGSMIGVFPAHHEGQRVGQVTSACHSPQLDKNIGYCMLPVELTELGTQVQVDTGRETVPATVAEQPFVAAKESPAESDSTTQAAS